MDMASHPTWLASEERRHVRSTIAITIDVDEPMRSQPATLIDLSAAGCRVQVAERVPLGRFITVRLSDSRSVQGWVAWSRRLEAGIDFATPLEDVVLGEIAAFAYRAPV